MFEALAFPAAMAGAALWRLGGSIDKRYRRLGIPALIALVGLTTQGPEPQIAIAAAAYAVTTRLPFTVLGDGIPDHWANWLWIPVWACLQTGPAVILSTAALPGAAACAGIITVFAVLSNLPWTARAFTWPLCELVFGACVAAPAVAFFTS